MMDIVIRMMLNGHLCVFFRAFQPKINYCVRLWVSSPNSTRKNITTLNREREREREIILLHKSHDRYGTYGCNWHRSA